MSGDGVERPLVVAVRPASLALPEAHVEKLARAVAGQEMWTPDVRSVVASAVPTPSFRQHARALCDAWEQESNATGREVALALESAVAAVSALRRGQAIDVVWTGPATADVPVRLTKDVLLELIGEARHELLVVSFAAYKVPEVVDALGAVAKRGVDVRLVLETSEDAGGALDFDAAEAFTALGGAATFYVWPAEMRQLNGGNASMHAKAVIADSTSALVTSANLTGRAISRNMELGVLIRGGSIPKRLASHFRSLMTLGVLQLV